jgi:hypothetical protein
MQTTMSALPVHARANRSTVAGQDIYWQVSYMKQIPPRRQIEESWKYCNLCTLKYPCQHVDAKQFAINTVNRWKTYPANPGNPLCIEFETSGFCTSFAARGHCHFHHDIETKISELSIPWGRCKVCTLPCKTRCYIHSPPLGRKLRKEDQELVVDGANVQRRFALGEIVGVASASAGGYVYAVVVEASKHQRMYTVVTHLEDEGRFSKNTGQKSLGELYRAQYRGWKRYACVMNLLGITEESLLREEEAEKKGAEEEEWSFDFVVAKVAAPIESKIDF